MFRLRNIVCSLIPDAFWQRVAHLLSRLRPKRNQAVCGRMSAILEDILFVPRSYVLQEVLPRKQFDPSGMTAWRRIEKWTRAGVWEKLQERLLDLSARIYRLLARPCIKGPSPARARRIERRRAASIIFSQRLTADHSLRRRRQPQGAPRTNSSRL
ncbi:MAG: transposase [Myxococcaceae bacterium]|nr:MAG: transposase [Myxococcaceae bacterium]